MFTRVHETYFIHTVPTTMIRLVMVSRDTEKTTSPHLLLPDAQNRRRPSPELGKGTARLAGTSY
eukprot:4806010-Prymnesium_polylepis.1